MLFSVAPAVFAVTYACVRGFVLNERYAIYIGLLLLLLLLGHTVVHKKCHLIIFLNNSVQN